MVDKIKFPEKRIDPTIEVSKKTKQPFIVQVAMWIIGHSGGLIKNEVQAAYVLLGFSVILIAISLLLFFFSGPKASMPPTGAPVYTDEVTPPRFFCPGQ